MFGKGISKEGDILDLAEKENIIEKSGAWYAYQGKKIGQGRENAKQLLRDRPELCEEIDQKVRAHYEALRAEEAEKAAAEAAAKAAKAMQASVGAKPGKDKPSDPAAKAGRGTSADTAKTDASAEKQDVLKNTNKPDEEKTDAPQRP